ncbi:MAG: thioredoxin [Clostridia bacterium]|nr:thioredoxin [Clostridia bacterium]
MAVKVLNNNNFKTEIIEKSGLALVDFYADWCGPCKMMAPVVEEIAAERADVTVGKINVDESGELALKYGVVSIPTLVVFKDGVEADRVVGFRPKEQITEKLK